MPYFIAPLVTGIGLFFTGAAGLFVIIGAICLLALFLIAMIRDAKPEAPEHRADLTATGKLP